MAVDPGKPPQTDSNLSLEQCAEMLRSRRTINFFRPEPVPRERLLEAIEVARWAPNHRLTEPWHFYLAGEETIRRIIDLIVELKTRDRDDVSPKAVRKRLEAVPGWFVLTSRLSPNMPVQQEEDYAACACAVQNLMLYLWQAGIGAKWTTGQVTRDPRLYDILGVDSSRERVMGLFWYGYPADKGTTRKRRDPGDISTDLP